MSLSGDPTPGQHEKQTVPAHWFFPEGKQEHNERFLTTEVNGNHLRARWEDIRNDVWTAEYLYRENGLPSTYRKVHEKKMWSGERKHYVQRYQDLYIAGEVFDTFYTLRDDPSSFGLEVDFGKANTPQKPERPESVGFVLFSSSPPDDIWNQLQVVGFPKYFKFGEGGKPPTLSPAVHLALRADSDNMMVESPAIKDGRIFATNGDMDMKSEPSYKLNWEHKDNVLHVEQTHVENGWTKVFEAPTRPSPDYVKNLIDYSLSAKIQDIPLIGRKSSITLGYKPPKQTSRAALTDFIRK